MTHDEYINTAAWHTLAIRRKQIDGFRCRVCNGDAHLQVHHRVYPEDFAQDNVDNLTTLCARCHAKVSEILGHGAHAMMTGRPEHFPDCAPTSLDWLVAGTAEAIRERIPLLDPPATIRTGALMENARGRAGDGGMTEADREGLQ